MSGDPFRVLGVAVDATADEVNEARRRLAVEHHPDRGGDPRRMGEINAAADEALRIIVGRTGPPDPRAAQEPGPSPSSPSPSADRGEPTRVARDAPSFTVEALPATTFEGLLVVATWMGEVLDDDPPYRLDTYLGEPFDCWCRLDVVPDAGASTVSLTVAGPDGAPTPRLDDVRDAWVANLNALDWPS